MFFIDANIFLEIQLADKKKEECKNFLRKVNGGEFSAITSNFIVYSSLLQIYNKFNSVERMKKFILSLSGIENLEIFAPNIEIILKTLDKMKEYNLDFDDALVVASMFANKIKKLVSFDKHFDKIKEIERIEPKDAL
ncbi:type II toxin-antitoxin system VapC family toxin [Candidatus Pacearchaeota archaeon]|nr:type II toxin-antitoxin system VapC family toxin [Candidatus Pacearchaeota archaeon]